MLIRSDEAPVQSGRVFFLDCRRPQASHYNVREQVRVPWRCGVNFFEQPPSKQWATLKYRGEMLAEVWFKPDGEPFVLAFRIPTENFQAPGIARQLTIENLLKAIGIVPEEVESWRDGDVSHSRPSGSDPGLKHPLAAPPQDVAHLDIPIRMRPRTETTNQQSRLGDEKFGDGSPSPDTLTPTPTSLPTPDQWQDLEARWKAVLGLEATIETFRLSMDLLLTEMENLLQKTLTIEEKSYAPRADIAQWERAKSRAHFALPKMRDFIHRATWALGAPERKRLEPLYKDHIQPQIPFPQMDEVLKRLEELQKDRQVLAALGKTVYQDSKGVSSGIQGVLRTLHDNAANARRKKDAAVLKGRFFK